MSRIANKPIPIPPNVTVSVDGSLVKVKGPKGELSHRLHPSVAVQLTKTDLGQSIQVSVPEPRVKTQRAFWGTAAAHLKNMLAGVTTGFKKELKIEGVGYTWSIVGMKLNLKLGFSHPVEYALPKGISGKITKTVLTLEGIDPELLGQTAAEIRGLKKPEPYKGKGIAMVGEHIRRKAGKQAKAAATA